MMTTNNLHLHKHVTSSREDYIRYEVDEDMFCFNLKWKTLLSIELFEDKGPCLINRYKHNGGAKLLMVHPCQWEKFYQKKDPTNLLSSRSASLIETSESIKVFNHF